MPFDTADEAIANELVAEAIGRGLITVSDGRVTYRLHHQRSYLWADPEEWVRAHSIAWLVISRDYPPNRIRTEVNVPRRTPNDFADIVVYRDDQCRTPYLVIENKASRHTTGARNQWIEQLFGNANSLRVPLGLYDEGDNSLLFDIGNFPPTERTTNRLGDRTALPHQYGETPEYAHVAGKPGDITAVDTSILSSRIRRAHYIIWAGGRRDPLLAFDEWSKLLFAKVIDERTTPTGHPRKFQFGTGETSAAVANRVHLLFREASRSDPTIFPPESRISLPDAKISEVVRCLQSLSFTRSDVDSVGRAFEEFFGSVFRGELGQYFTMRQLARFTVAVLEISPNDYVLDPTAGSGGFLLEALLQTWHSIDRDFSGQPDNERERLKTDFALSHVYGIEIHEVLARICKINLLLHHDGHTNIEADRSCLDTTFTNPRLNNPRAGFSSIVGNPPFGDEVTENDEDHLGANRLANFEVAEGRIKVDSEQVILERCVQFLEPGGRFGLVLPDGTLNNQGFQSNCPQTRTLLAKRGRIEAIVSLPDHAFRKSGAQNKTSILFFRKFTTQEQRTFDRAFAAACDGLQAQEREQIGRDLSDQTLVRLAGNAIPNAIRRGYLDYQVFLAEANDVGYTPAGSPSDSNDLYRAGQNGSLATNQGRTILGEWKSFLDHPGRYIGRTQPDCMAITATALWDAHPSHRLDPKYHLFQHEAQKAIPHGWVRDRIGNLMRQRDQPVGEFQSDRVYTVLTISNTGQIRARLAGKGNNPASWTGDYFSEVSPGDWFAAETGDVVFSSIDLWKGCIAIVPREFDGGLVTKEFPIYEVIDDRLTPQFLQTLLRSRYYQRAFRAITTGHSNRRRTQIADFEALEISFPPKPADQERLIREIMLAQQGQRDAAERLKGELLTFSDIIDGRGTEELPEIIDSDDVGVHQGP
ncbi:MAG TPA: N-6 DNA methylase [Pyrinomonadaceae bacterium]|jgi:type I restriction enzyme M protein|nr:N-6 DNA methylase [Pyrinomonadaceae bacterium]